ncbi:acetylglutamate kinase [Dehalobacterium formicoaceticum]|uniref:acetylglutamate kinase n=1 Tax=Dehalobacterium formicoaceticum TaxID=51515 RepID=UPI0031F61FA0
MQDSKYTPLERAQVLIEALPYIRRFHGKTVVIKYGGSAMLSDELKKAVMNDVILMKLVGMNPILVHGGGPEINHFLKRLDIKSEFVNGLRVTDEPTMEVVEMVLVGKVNKEIVAQINRLGGHAVGLCGKDGQMILARKQYEWTKDADGRETMVDIGSVGEVEKINTGIIESIMETNGYIPVIAPIGAGVNGESYNINADLVAGEIAGALGAEKLILLTDVEGIFYDLQDKSSILSVIKTSEIDQLMQDGIIAGGMIPKVKCCMRALEAGVQGTHIIDGRLPHSILLELFTDKGIGTMVEKD